MKRFAFTATLIGLLLFNGLTSVGAFPQIAWYVRWSEPVTYDCTGTPGDRTLSVRLTHLDYFVPEDVKTVETTIADNSNGHFDDVYETLDPIWTGGTHPHYTYTIDSAAYPITLKEVVTTYVGKSAVYQSTFVAKCSGNGKGLQAKISNNDNPPQPLTTEASTPITAVNP